MFFKNCSYIVSFTVCLYYCLQHCASLTVYLFYCPPYSVSLLLSSTLYLLLCLLLSPTLFPLQRGRHHKNGIFPPPKINGILYGVSLLLSPTLCLPYIMIYWRGLKHIWRFQCAMNTILWSTMLSCVSSMRIKHIIAEFLMTIMTNCDWLDTNKLFHTSRQHQTLVWTVYGLYCLT